MRIQHFDTSDRVWIVAEIGNNHEGDYASAERMVNEAARAGADAVKFQTFQAERYVGFANPSRLRQLKAFELSYPQFERLRGVAERAGVMFLSTPFDPDSAEFLAPLVPAFKIASGDNNYGPLIDRVASFGKPILLSTGLADMALIERTCRRIESVWDDRGTGSELALLHCVSSYPTPPEEAGLQAIRALRERFGYVTGYSDHTLGVEAAVLAAAVGARIIEKHFTLNKNHSSFRDHQLSADPTDLAELVRRVRQVDAYLGSAGKRIQPLETENLLPMRRSIVTRKDLPAGHAIQWEDLDWVRPGGGLPPGSESDLLGRRLIRDVQRGAMLSLDLFADQPDRTEELANSSVRGDACERETRP